MISNRLNQIVNFIKDDHDVADIGSDHGLLLVLLNERNFPNKVLGVENKIGPYKNLERTIKSINKPNFSSNLSSVYGSGGVPASKLSEALNMYVYAEPIPIPPYYSWTVANQVVAAIDQGSFYHMVTILGTNGGTVFYRDDQNGRYLTCPSHLIRSVFRVSGVR